MIKDPIGVHTIQPSDPRNSGLKKTSVKGSLNILKGDRGETARDEIKVVNRWKQYFEGLFMNEVGNTAQAPGPHVREKEISVDYG